jgi:hypothetical protein
LKWGNVKYQFLGYRINNRLQEAGHDPFPGPGTRPAGHLRIVRLREEYENRLNVAEPEISLEPVNPQSFES